MSSSSSSGGGAYEPIDGISPGWNYVGFVRVGSNGTIPSVWEYSVGADTITNCTTSDRVWDSNIADGINSNWVKVSLTVKLSGTAASTGKITVGGTDISYSQGDYARMTKVQIQVSASGLQGDMRMQEISAEFFRADGSSAIVLIPPSSNPDANNSAGTGTVSQALQINPPSNVFVSVTVDLQVRLSTEDTTLPAPDSLSAGIYVFTA